jgi:hypothetical protein
MEDGYYISAGTETLTAMTHTVIKTSVNALRLSPVQRNCYTDSEFPFKYIPRDMGFRYSMKNCLYESVLEKTIEICKCLPDFLNFQINLIYSICSGDDLTCAMSQMNKFGSSDADMSRSDKGTLLKVNVFAVCVDREKKVYRKVDTRHR